MRGKLRFLTRLFIQTLVPGRSLFFHCISSHQHFCFQPSQFSAAKTLASHCPSLPFLLASILLPTASKVLFHDINLILSVAYLIPCSVTDLTLQSKQTRLCLTVRALKSLLKMGTPRNCQLSRSSEAILEHRI